MNATSQYTRAELIKIVYLLAACLGAAYWGLFLVVYSVLQAPTLQLAAMSLPYSIVGLALLLVAMDAFRSGHYWLSLHFYAGLFLAGLMA